MKTLIALIISLTSLLLSSELLGQVSPGSAKNPADKSTELHEVNIIAPAAPIAFKEDNITKRENFYAPKTNFDTANQYDSLFMKSASSGLNKKNETGIVKLMNDNSSTPMVCYNNASTGTILQLTNPENGKVVYVVVVGKIPPSESNVYLLKISDMVARKLSIKDYNSVELVCYIE
jgi:hypothetical protein